MATPLEPSDDFLEDDFYAILNVSREAKRDEINQAFKQLSKVYHPDKHPDLEKKKKAEQFFTKLKRAHTVLTDEHTRVLYNLYGEKGLESASGMEVVARTKTPAEIIAEYERLQQYQEEQRLNQKTNPTSEITIKVDATDIFEPIEDDDMDQGYSIGIPLEVNSMSIYQTVECPLTTRNTITLGAEVAAHNGRGTGAFTMNWTRLFNGWSAVFRSSIRSPDGSVPLGVSISKPLFRNCRANLNLGIDLTGDVHTTMINYGADVTYFLDRHWQGNIRFTSKSMFTTLKYETEKHIITLQVKLMLENCYLFAKYVRKFDEQKTNANISVRAYFNALEIQYGVNKKITEYSSISAQVVISIPLFVKLKLSLHRGRHTINMPIMLSTLSGSALPSSIVYATITPLIAYAAVKKLIVDPFLSDQKEKDLQKKRQEQKEKIQTRRREALAQVELMAETVDRCIETEERKNGLIIIRAVYGKLTAEEEVDLQSEECIDVTVPLQALVKDSKLISYDKNTKSDLPGFFDPCVGEDKKLYIKYRFHKKLHHTTVGDREILRLPQQRHLIREDEMPPFISDEKGDM